MTPEDKLQDFATAQNHLESMVIKFLVKLNRAHLGEPAYIGNLTYEQLQEKFSFFLMSGEVE
jgi:hypothetical protein